MKSKAKKVISILEDFGHEVSESLYQLYTQPGTLSIYEKVRTIPRVWFDREGVIFLEYKTRGGFF